MGEALAIPTVGKEWPHLNTPGNFVASDALPHRIRAIDERRRAMNLADPQHDMRQPAGIAADKKQVGGAQRRDGILVGCRRDAGQCHGAPITPPTTTVSARSAMAVGSLMPSVVLNTSEVKFEQSSPGPLRPAETGIQGQLPGGSKAGT